MSKHRPGTGASLTLPSGLHWPMWLIISCPFTSEVWVRYRTNPCEIYGGKSDTGTGFLLSILFCPVSSMLPMLYIHYSYRRNKWVKPGNVKTKQYSFGHRGAMERKVKSDLMAPAFGVSFIVAWTKKAVKFIVWADGGDKNIMPAPVSSFL